jgi:hypothetical protein
MWSNGHVRRREGAQKMGVMTGMLHTGNEVVRLDFCKVYKCLY